VKATPFAVPTDCRVKVIVVKVLPAVVVVAPAPVPIALIALTRYEYAVPFTNPVTVIDGVVLTE
jgi:hypothetical protein